MLCCQQEEVDAAANKLTTHKLVLTPATSDFAQKHLKPGSV